MISDPVTIEEFVRRIKETAADGKSPYGRKGDSS
jgi:hypothetical protein